MGGRGSSSATGSRSGSSVTLASKVLQPNGHISLNANDYAGRSQGEVQEFFSTLPYEVAAIFDEDGNVVSLKSQWQRGHVNITASEMEAAIRQYVSNGGSGGQFTMFHNHPNHSRSDTYQPSVPSVKDIGYFSYIASYTGPKPTIFEIKSSNVESNGPERKAYVLEYVGGGTISPSRMAQNYSHAMRNAGNKAVSNLGWSAGGVALANDIDRTMDRWLIRNSRKYGFLYSSEIESWRG